MEKPGMTKKIWNSMKNIPTFFGSVPKIILCSSISSMADNPCEGDEMPSNEDAARSVAPKTKRKQKSKSSASEMIEFLEEFKEDKQKEEKEKLAALHKMHNEKIDLMN